MSKKRNRPRLPEWASPARKSKARDAAPLPPERAVIDEDDDILTALLKAAAYGVLVGVSAHVAKEARRFAKARARFEKVMTDPPAFEAPPPPPWQEQHESVPELPEESAAALLGVEIDASEDAIRTAYRDKVRGAMSRGGFHDQGGELAETVRVNAAKNLLMERARRRRYERGTS